MNERFKNIKSISDIVDLMIRGLKREWVRVDMETYGSIYYDDKPLCAGCAATNTLCEIMQESFDLESILHRDKRLNKFNYGITIEELFSFERGINSLRNGDIALFIYWMREISHLLSFEIPETEVVYKSLPQLTTSNYLDYLHHYEVYRDQLRSKGL